MTLTIRVGAEWTANGPARLGGLWLHQLAPTQGVKFSHALPGGCLSASWNWGARHAGVKRGALVEIFDLGVRVWLGALSELNPFTGEYAARGNLTAQSRCAAKDAQNAATTNIAVAAAAAITPARGWRFIPDADLPSSTLSSLSETESQSNTLPALLAEFQTRTGRPWRCDEQGRLSVAATSDLPDPTLILTPDSPAMASADDTQTTRVYVRYVSEVTAGQPTAWDDATANDAPARNTYGPAEDQEDITTHGLLQPADAQSIAAGILADREARVTYVEAARATTLTARSPGRVRRRPTMIRPGETVLHHGQLDVDGRANLNALTPWQIGQTDYDDSEPDAVTLTPVGFAPRTQAGVTAALARLGLAGTPMEFS